MSAFGVPMKVSDSLSNILGCVLPLPWRTLGVRWVGGFGVGFFGCPNWILASGPSGWSTQSSSPRSW